MTVGLILIGVEIGAQRLAKLQAEFPDLRFAVTEDAATFAAHAPEAEVLLGRGIDAATADAMTNLRWVQTWSAGIERWLRLGLHTRGVRFSNAAGVHGIPMSEVILGMMLAFSTGLHTLIRAQTGRDEVRAAVRSRKFELAGQTVCVVGLGGIGGALAQRCQALGLTVTGIRRAATPHPHVDRLYPVEEIIKAVAEADHVALSLPLTLDTAGIIGAAELRAMPTHAYIYNVGRGGTIDATALNQALHEGWIAGAGLDVTDPEPLPHDSPLWDADNVILSQHTSGTSPRNFDRIVQLFADNLQRYLAGDTLHNEIDPARGY